MFLFPIVFLSDRIPGMAKKKGPRHILGLKCAVCGTFNYVSQRNRNNTAEKIELRKYCKVCRKHALHKEMKKLK